MPEDSITFGQALRALAGDEDTEVLRHEIAIRDAAVRQLKGEVERLRAEVERLNRPVNTEALERIIFAALFPRTAWVTRSSEKRRQLPQAVEGILRELGKMPDGNA